MALCFLNTRTTSPNESEVRTALGRCLEMRRLSRMELRLLCSTRNYEGELEWILSNMLRV